MENQPSPLAGRPGAAARLMLRDEVHDRLLAVLLDGTLAPGDRVSIDALARSLAVSPTPVREALAHLENTGLIERTALRGYRVAPPLTTDQLNDLIDARRAVELAALDAAMSHPVALAGDLAARHDEDERLVRELGLTEPDTAPDFEAFRAYFEADWAFHTAILTGSGNSYLARMGANLGFQAHRLRQTFGTRSLDAGEALGEHAAVLAAVRAGDRALAVSRMSDHLEGVRERSLGVAARHSSTPRPAGGRG